MPDITVINLSPQWTVCIVCGDEIPLGGYYVAMFEGEIVDEDTAEEWGGFQCCEECAHLNADHVGEPLVPDRVHDDQESK